MKSKLLLAILFLVAEIAFVSLAQSGPPSFPTNAVFPASVVADPLAGIPLPIETHASFKIDWVWPPNIAEYGPIPIVDAATNFAFLVLTSPLLSNPEWRLKYTFPGKSITPISNYWTTNIWEEVSTSAFFQIIVTNILNQSTSTTTSIPSPTASCMLLSTPTARVTSLTKNK